MRWKEVKGRSEFSQLTWGRRSLPLSTALVMIQAIYPLSCGPFQKRLIVLVLLSTVPGRGGAELRVGL